MLRPKRIILHCSDTEDAGTVSWQAIRKYHMEVKGWNDIGYHFGVEKIGDRYEILAGRMLDVKGAHCEGENYDSIGICFVGKFDEQPPPLQQFILGVQLTRALCSVLGIMASNIFPHRAFNSGKTCPGLKFDMGEFIKQLNPY